MFSWKKARDEEGTVVILAAVFIVIVLGFAALSVDVGFIMTAEAELQNAADAGAMAGLSQLLEGNFDGAVSEAVNFASQNSCAGRPVGVATGDVVLGWYDFDQGTFTPVPGGVGANSIRVEAKRTQNSVSGPLPLFFMGVLGTSVADIQATATAAVDHRVVGIDGSVASGVMPFAIHETIVGNPPVPGRRFNLYPNSTSTNNGNGNGNGNSTAAPGNFGLLDLNDSNPSVPILRDWIEDGYDGVVQIPASGQLLMPGTPGLRNTLRSSVADRIGDTVFIFVFTTLSGQGSNSVYTIVNLCPVLIHSVQGNGHANLYIDVEIVEAGSSGIITSPTGAYNATTAKVLVVQ